jgi:hypothetical protein
LVVKKRPKQLVLDLRCDAGAAVAHANFDHLAQIATDSVGPGCSPDLD